MTLQYPCYVIVFYIFYNTHTMIGICRQITFWKICLKLKNIFDANKFMVYAYEKKRVLAFMTLIRGIISLFQLVL